MRFQTDPLGEAYRSTEAALKELVDNAWDANAGIVNVTLPDPMTDAPIVIADDYLRETTITPTRRRARLCPNYNSQRINHRFRRVNPSRASKNALTSP